MARTRREVPWLSQRKNGTYYIRWYDSEAGYCRSLSLRTRDPGQAQARYAAFLAQGTDELTGRASTDPAEALTCEQCLADYVTEHVQVKVIDQERLIGRPDDPDTLWTPGSIVGLLHAHFGGATVSALNEPGSPLVEAYISRRRAGQLGRKAQDSTIRKELGSLVAAFGHAVRRRRLPKADKPHVELPDKTEPKDRWLTRDELPLLLDAAKVTRVQSDEGLYVAGVPEDELSRLYRFCMLAYITAARKRSVLALTIFAVDLENQTIDLRKPGRQAANKPRRKVTKKRRALVPIPSEFMPFVRRLVEDAKQAGTEYLLDHPGAIDKAFRAAVARAGLAGTGVTPHVLRHTRAVHLAQQGVDLYAIAGLLGDTIETVYRNYLHHCPEHLRKKIEGLWTPEGMLNDAYTEDNQASRSENGDR